MDKSDSEFIHFGEHFMHQSPIQSNFVKPTNLEVQLATFDHQVPQANRVHEFFTDENLDNILDNDATPLMGAMEVDRKGNESSGESRTIAAHERQTPDFKFE